MVGCGPRLTISGLMINLSCYWGKRLNQLEEKELNDLKEEKELDYFMEVEKQESKT